MQSVNETWFNKDRSETASQRMANRKFGSIEVSNPALGINIYNNAITKEDSYGYINVLEENLNGDGPLKWQKALVTNSDSPIDEARKCYDFKIKGEQESSNIEETSKLLGMYYEIFEKVKQCVDDYAQYWGINVVFYEAFNFVKYDGPGHQFKIHADHGPMYNTTVSIVVYLNDDYEGGEIYWPRLDGLVHKPKFGDIAVFPSNYIYEHASLDLQSGIKYSVVIMSDINKLSH